LEKRPEFDRKFSKEIVPFLARSTGLIELLMLQDDIELDTILVFSLWKTREDAERYQRSDFAKIQSVLEPYLTFPPAVHTYKVNTGNPMGLPASMFQPETMTHEGAQFKSGFWR